MTGNVPRHCTECGGRIWSLTRVTLHTNYNSAKMRDLCNDCDPDNRDLWEVCTTGGNRRADR